MQPSLYMLTQYNVFHFACNSNQDSRRAWVVVETLPYGNGECDVTVCYAMHKPELRRVFDSREKVRPIAG